LRLLIKNVTTPNPIARKDRIMEHTPGVYSCDRLGLHLNGALIAVFCVEDAFLEDSIARKLNAHDELVEALKKMLVWADNPAPRLPRGHVCGTPDAICDCDCMTMGHYQQDAVEARAALAKAEE
jgi:hypothetical protein